MLKLHYYGESTIPLEAEAITPENLAGKSVSEIATLPLQHGNRAAPLGDFFEISGSVEDLKIEIEGDCSRVKWLGAGMKQGAISIRGAAGMHLGSEMAGGTIEVFGDAGDWVGAEMTGGRITVHGNAGHLIGSAYRGGHVGMRGGAILIQGDVGNEIGGHMRRGLIAVGGSAGDFAGVGLIAGSIFLFGQPGLRTGAGMKRGTIAIFGGEASLLPTFRYDCHYRPVFLSIYLRQLGDWGFKVPEGSFQGQWKRYSGDMVELGKGEILIREQ